MRLLYYNNEIDFFSTNTSDILNLPYLNVQPNSSIYFNSTDDYLEEKISLNKDKIKNPSTTFYGRVKGVSMTNVGVFPKDILVIDIASEPCNEDILICYIEGNFTLKQVKKDKDGLWIISGNKSYEPILITEDIKFLIWGIVTHVI